MYRSVARSSEVIAVSPNERPRTSGIARSRGFWSGTIVLFALCVFSFIGPSVYLQDATTINVNQQLLPPSWKFPLGTNVLGQNELARLMLGGQLPIAAGIVTTLIVMFIGIATGVLAGVRGGVWDNVLMWITDGVMSIPQVVLVLFIEVTHGSTPVVLVLAVSLTAWPAAARVVRSQVLLIRQMEYVQAARAVGNPETRLIMRHIIPNLTDTILAVGASQFANSVLVLAIATFVGLGVGSFDWASMMASDFRDVVSGQWWLVVPPGVLFSALILSVYSIGESARQALRPSGRLTGGR